MDTEKLNAIIKKSTKDLIGILACQNDEEIYAYKNPKLYKENFMIASATKSVISILIGMALDQGLIKSVDEKVLSFFPEYECPADEPLKRSITIKHLLTMSASFPYPNWKEPLERFCKQKNWVLGTLDMLGNGGITGEYKYSSFGVHLLSAILTKVTGKSAREYANEKLFLPLGLEEVPDSKNQEFSMEGLFKPTVRSWVHDRQNISTGGWGLCISLNDMLRIGQLYLNQGFYNGKQLLSPQYIKESITPQYSKSVYLDYNYGYLWWLCSFQGHFSNLAVGDGGNVICCIPDKNLVVAITSEHNGREVDFPSVIEALMV